MKRPIPACVALACLAYGSGAFALTTGTTSDAGTLADALRGSGAAISAGAQGAFDVCCPDADGDGVCDSGDNCPGVANPGQTDGDGDGIGDICDSCPADAQNDSDGDGVCGDLDVCPGTTLPEGVPTVKLGVNRFADVDGDGVFDTTLPDGNGPGKTYTIAGTGGCSCEQIIDALGLGAGHTKFGCSISAMDDWIALH